jgi:hypothetical protein
VSNIWLSLVSSPPGVCIGMVELGGSAFRLVVQKGAMAVSSLPLNPDVSNCLQSSSLRTMSAHAFPITIPGMRDIKFWILLLTMVVSIAHSLRRLGRRLDIIEEDLQQSLSQLETKFRRPG